MSDVTRTTSVTWTDRLRESIKGFLSGIVLVALCLVGLFWNEGRTVGTIRALEEGAGMVVAVDAGKVDPAHEGRLVHVTGAIATDAALADAGFAVSANAVRLIRKAEMYQWKETSKSETKTKLGGGQETVTTYSYTQEWSSAPIDSARFQQRGGHGNPSMEIRGRTIEAAEARLGAFTLGEAVLSRVRGAQPLAVDPGQAGRILAAYGGSKPVRIQDGRVYLADNPNSPSIGDYRISYEVVPPGTISVVGRQSGSTLTRYPTAAGESVLLVQQGRKAAGEMFSDAQSANSALTWALRAAGLALLYVGFVLVLGPIAVTADVIPFLGSIARTGTGILSLCLALVLGALTIAVAWVFYRPIVAAAIIGAGVVLAWAIARYGRRRAARAEAKAAAPA